MKIGRFACHCRAFRLSTLLWSICRPPRRGDMGEAELFGDR
jgi:hypothetical protein